MLILCPRAFAVWFGEGLPEGHSIASHSVQSWCGFLYLIIKWASSLPFWSIYAKNLSFVLRCWFLAGFLFCLASHSDSDDKSIHNVLGWICFSYWLCQTLVLFSLLLSLPPATRFASEDPYTYPQSFSQSRRWSNLLWLRQPSCYCS